MTASTAANASARGLPPLPLGFLGMLALVLLAEWYLTKHEIDFTTPPAFDWKLSGQLAKRKAVGCEILCFGDSLVKFGVLPPVIERQVGISSFNLALSAGHAPASYFLLRRALNAGARPRAIVIDGENLLDDPLSQTRLWPELVNLREAAELARAARDASFFATVCVSKLIPSVRVRYEVRANLTAALRGQFGTSKYTLRTFLRNWRVNRGSQVLARNPKLDIEPIARVYLPIGWKCHGVNAHFLRRLLDLAASRRIAVYWLLPPVCPEIQARREEGGADADYMRFLAHQQARYANLVVIDGRHAGYDRTLHADATHLDSVGSGAMSVAVAEIVARGLRGENAARWIPLPQYREQPNAIALEDLSQSILASRLGRREVTR